PQRPRHGPAREVDRSRAVSRGKGLDDRAQGPGPGRPACRAGLRVERDRARLRRSRPRARGARRGIGGPRPRPPRPLRAAPETRGAHGYRNADPVLDAAFAAIGPGIEPSRPATVSILEVASRAARALGIDPPRGAMAAGR